ncbi:GSCOCG00002962001-RA-CDS [Cotesia congregata]|uniref:Mitochondrial cardiolipin hydrolase n=1 Tax=Cotesia congregata TaxID=51543 RepID=A0A8J2MM70_COTCN|nr:GSCOCG00002962001-RA-CDS [Cotesia congregata]CAG5093811.1 Similar to CHLREDRAFT_190403: Mitochondrial cardiolipin hydrolase (Chlamydomonas reinhardtii) [Cotesia congregata]
MINKIISITFCTGVGVLTTELCWRLWKSYKKAKVCQEEEDENNKLISEVFFFAEDSMGCRAHASRKKACGSRCPINCINRIIYYMDNAKKTLDVCMYIVTCQEIINAISRAHKRKVNVRVIADASMSENSACGDQLTRLRRTGIKVRIQRSKASLMHHKFTVSDKHTLIYGSTNWTMQAFFGNYDGIIMTNQKQLVEPFNDEFDRIWEKLK